MKAKAEIVGSMAAFGTIGIFVRHIPLASGELALLRAMTAALFLLLGRFAPGNLLNGRK